MITEELLHFQKFVRALSQEFVEAQGGISAEFSTDSADLLFKIKTLHQNAINSGGIVADWVIYILVTLAKATTKTDLCMSNSYKATQNGCTYREINHALSKHFLK